MLHHHTPLIRSTPLSDRVGRPVWLKLESSQPCGSFKQRGMGRACEVAVQRGARRLITSSGGNAGYAVAHAGRALRVPVDVVVPSRTSPRMRALIEAEGATVSVWGDVWDDAHERAVALAAAGDGALVHPFDAPEVWDGHATLVAEVAAAGVRPGLVVASVGGGGLLAGVVQGMQGAGWSDVPVLAVETHGAASYAAALKAGAPVTLPRIDSLALTLGARTVCQRAVDLAREHPISAWQCDDRAAVEACVRFLDDHRVLVEPACGAALASVYGPAPVVAAAESVLVVVCGGASVTRDALDGWVTQTGGSAVS
jgi:L-serine/L-threonine ammonia-lyase